MIYSNEIFKITVIALNQKVGIDIKNELKDIFGELIQIQLLTLDDLNSSININTDLIIFHDPKVLLESMPYIGIEQKVLMTKRTILRSGLEKLKQIPFGKRCLVINMTDFSIMQTITALYQLGINHVQFVPYDWNQVKKYNVDYIIAPAHFPELNHIEGEVIYFGHRPLEISTLLDIMAVANFDSDKSEEIIKRQMKRVPTFWKGVLDTLTDRRTLYAYWKILFDEFSQAIIIIDETDIITMLNHKASEILGFDCESLIGEHIRTLINNTPQWDIFLSNKSITNEVVTFDNNTFVFNLHCVDSDGINHGKIILFEEFHQIMSAHQSIRKQVISRGHVAKYSFTDIVGISPSITKAIKTCKVIANSEATILLTGESGTGKEIFASALHNHSHRQKEPYVAINCATLPESILESELFGYEEGAFTGAKKGGKIGLFEQAHNGTLFMDEIGELPISIQARLLRVLQEKEIIRVGGGSIINVNTRIIAATNRNLKQMVDEGTFRNDLYFRLNVFQIQLPSLKERPEDIPILIKNKVKNNPNIKTTSELMDFFKIYDWPGNVRELYNVLEYILTFSNDVLSTQYLPSYISQSVTFLGNKEVSELVRTHTNKSFYVLQMILKLEINNKASGRRSILQALKNDGIILSEGILRNVIKELSDNEYLTVQRGRGGCRLTPQGLIYLEEFKQQ